MCSTGDSAALPTLGCPIRESTGQRLFSASPWLIAAVHALRRLLVPRHPPCALNILTVIRSTADLPFRGPGADPVIPVFQPPLIWRLMWLLCSFQGPRRGTSRRPELREASIAAPLQHRPTPVLQNSTGR